MDNMSWFDRFIGFVSPRTAYERQAYKQALRTYDAGAVGRVNSGWRAVNQPAEQEDNPYRDTIRARARNLEKNSDIAESVIGAFERNVVGPQGFRVQAKVKNKDGRENEELNQELEDLWKEWQRPRNCDITGAQSFAEMCKMAIRRKIVDGGIAFIRSYTDGGPVPLTLQPREVDELDTAKTFRNIQNQNRISGGIEFDKYNRPVAYYFKKFTPDGFFAGESERIDADRVIFLWSKKRPTQIREMSELAITVPRVRDVNEFVEAVGVKARVEACLAAFITKQNPTGSGLGRGNAGGTKDKDSGYSGRTLSPGMVLELQPGEDVKAVVPSGSGSSAREFVTLEQRLIGGGQGLSYEAVSRDMSQVNYSSARQGMLEDQKTYGEEQQFLIDHFLAEVYESFVISAVMSKAVNINVVEFWKDKKNYLRHTWIPTGWSWIDPLKEANANKVTLETGQSTLAEISAQAGKDWREVIDQRARELTYMKDKGITLGGENSNGQKEQNANITANNDKGTNA
jgi:lambda family phage portal protein